MKSLIFAKRNIKELIKDPLSLIFCIGLPLFLLVMISVMQKSIKVDQFEIGTFAPGIIVFSFAFITLFSAMLISNDRKSSFLIRLYTSPLTVKNFVIGYTLPLLLIALVQSVLCLLVSSLFGLTITTNLFITFLLLLPVSILFVGIGFLLGSFASDKQVGGFASIIINLVAFTSGMWFNIEMIGGIFKTICEWLPFYSAVNIIKYGLNASGSGLLRDLIIVFIYAFGIYILSIIIFRKKMKNN